MPTQQRAPFGLRMPEDLKSWVHHTAHNEGRSINNLIVRLLTKAMDEASTPKDTPHMEG